MVTRSTWSNLPAALPNGSLLPQVSARLRQDTVDAVFITSGGGEKLLAFTEASEENYKFFLQHLWAKGLPRVSSAEVAHSGEGVEELLARLDAGEHARVVSPDADAPSDVP